VEAEIGWPLNKRTFLVKLLSERFCKLPFDNRYPQINSSAASSGWPQTITRCGYYRQGTEFPGRRRCTLARRDPALIADRKFARLAHDRRAIQRLNVLPIPTVALVQGACFGGGTGIISACDIVIAADNATFSIAEVRIGVAATIIIPQLNDAIRLALNDKVARMTVSIDSEQATSKGGGQDGVGDQSPRLRGRRTT
jgi:Enoyl-CoA hydratase/isomerase